MSRSRSKAIALTAVAALLVLTTACGEDGERPSVSLPPVSRPTTSVPAGETTAPAEETTAPGEETTVPAEETTAPPATTRPPVTTQPPTTEPPPTTTEPPSTTTEPPPTTTEPPPTSEEAGQPTTLGPDADGEDNGSSGLSWWWLVAGVAVVAILVAALARSRRQPTEPSGADLLAAAAERGRALADSARVIATTTDTNALAFRWAQFDRDHDELGRQLTPLGARDDVAADAARLQQAASDLAAAVAYDRDLRLGGSATADQLSYSRASVLERAEAVTETAGPRESPQPA